jgi:hypothetical protein
MSDPRKHAGVIISLVVIVGLSTPTAAEQARIREGTALAKLVAEVSTNTPEMTVAAAAPPKLDIPPWLAAHYRRNHSELPKAALQLDPTGGYPLVLENLYVWMLRNQDLKAPPAPEFKAASAVTVAPNVRISGANDTPRSESDIQSIGAPRHNAHRLICTSGGRQLLLFAR